MKVILILMLGLLVVACTTEQQMSPDIGELLLTDQELTMLGMMRNESNCEMQTFETSENSPLEQNALCYYTFEDNRIILQHSKLTNTHDATGAYQMQSSQRIESEWRISEDTYGDSSTFQKWNESTTYYYHLWILQDTYVLHVTSSGAEEVGDVVLEIGDLLMERFE